jgi:hypothetical protein
MTENFQHIGGAKRKEPYHLLAISAPGWRDSQASPATLPCLNGLKGGRGQQISFASKSQSAADKRKRGPNGAAIWPSHHDQTLLILAMK